jgi:hypothetical protein
MPFAHYPTNGQAAFVRYPPKPNSPMSLPGEIYMTMMPGAMSVRQPPQAPQGGREETAEEKDAEEKKEREERNKKEAWRLKEKNLRLFATPDAKKRAKTLEDVAAFVNERRDEIESEQLVEFIRDHPDIGIARSLGLCSLARSDAALLAWTSNNTLPVRASRAREKSAGVCMVHLCAASGRGLTCVRLPRGGAGRSVHAGDWSPEPPQKRLADRPCELQGLQFHPNGKHHGRLPSRHPLGAVDRSGCHFLRVVSRLLPSRLQRRRRLRHLSRGGALP